MDVHLYDCDNFFNYEEGAANNLRLVYQKLGVACVSWINAH